MEVAVGEGMYCSEFDRFSELCQTLYICILYIIKYIFIYII